MVDVVSLVVAAAALVVAVYSWLTASRAARNDVLAQVRDWGGEVVDMLADARGLCQLRTSGIDPKELVLRRADLSVRASALLDRGRFFFPNWGAVRPHMLALVMLAYELMPRIGDQSADSERLEMAFNYLQSVVLATVRKAVNFSTAPASVKKYEEHLSKIQAQPLPLEMWEMRATRHGSTLAFDDRSLDEIPLRDPKPSA